MDKKHRCPYCGQAFDRVDALAQHILKAHKGEIKRTPKSSG
ncbi:MAG: hypothetical protein JXB47_10875 [Anaerolineae bacterium]|nr:hypothetical protein [Anaerolineae bacterium]